MTVCLQGIECISTFIYHDPNWLLADNFSHASINVLFLILNSTWNLSRLLFTCFIHCFIHLQLKWTKEKTFEKMAKICKEKTETKSEQKKWLKKMYLKIGRICEYRRLRHTFALFSLLKWTFISTFEWSLVFLKAHTKVLNVMNLKMLQHLYRRPQSINILNACWVPNIKQCFFHLFLP